MHRITMYHTYHIYIYIYDDITPFLSGSLDINRM